jgi:hypothetical protein
MHPPLLQQQHKQVPQQTTYPQKVLIELHVTQKDIIRFIHLFNQLTKRYSLFLSIIVLRVHTCVYERDRREYPCIVTVYTPCS